MGKGRIGYCLRHVLDYLSRHLRSMNNDQTRGKKKRPAPTACKAGTCLWSISEILQCQTFHGVFTWSTVSRRVRRSCGAEQVNMCFSRFPTISSKGRGEKRKTDTGWRRRVNPHSHIPHLQIPGPLLGRNDLY